MKQQGISAAMAGHARHKPVPAHLKILQPMTGSVNLVSEYLAAGLQASYEPYATEINKKKRQRKVGAQHNAANFDSNTLSRCITADANCCRSWLTELRVPPGSAASPWRLRSLQAG